MTLFHVTKKITKQRLKMTKIIIILSGLFSLNVQANLDQIIKKHIKSYKLNNEQVGFYLHDVKQNKTEYSFNDKEVFYPASIFKSFTAYYILKNLGPKTTLKTELSYSGELKNEKIEGNLYLMSEGDPYLLTNDIYDLVFILQKKGITEITGNLKIISNLPSLERIGNVGLDDQAYNQSIAPFNINFNRFKAIKNGTSYYSLPVNTQLNIIKSPQSLSPGEIFQRLKGDKEVWKSYQTQKWYYELPLRNATHLNAFFVLETLKKNGIKISNSYNVVEKQTNTTPLFTKESLPIWRLIDLGLEFSNNFFMETLLLKATNTTDLKEASEIMKSYLVSNFKGINFKDINFDRGSGLTVNTQLRSDILAKFFSQTALERFADKYFISYFSMSGTGGFLAKKYLTRSTHEKFFAKTGSMDYVNNICGYIIGTSPKSFCLLVNDKKKRIALQGPNSNALEQMRQDAKEWKKRTDRFLEDVLTSYLRY